MAYEVVMPQMGADMKEGTLIRWLKKEGDEVQRGEAIAEIETDKANIEIEAFEGGVFRKALAKPGDVVAVGQVIAVLGARDEDISKYEAPAAAREPRTGNGDRQRPSGGASASTCASAASRRRARPRFAGRAAHGRGEGRRPGAGAGHGPGRPHHPRGRGGVPAGAGGRQPATTA